MKTYTITTDGTSNSNVIAQPFTIEVTQMVYNDNQFAQSLTVGVITKNGADVECCNDDIPQSNTYDLPAMTSSKNSDLSDFEALLEEKYPGNWS